MKKLFALILALCMVASLACCGAKQETKPAAEENAAAQEPAPAAAEEPAATEEPTPAEEPATAEEPAPAEENTPAEEEPAAAEGINYLALVNKLNPLPEGWEEALETVHITNSVGDDVEVEKKAYDAYLRLKDDLEKNDGIYTELDSARRSVAAQQDIMDRFIEKYGAEYAARTVATPGYSEHHTGLALDLYFKLKNDDGTFTDVYHNEDMVQYPEIWEKIHEKLADYGFILRYLEGREHITGYGYEPWHIRYLDDADRAKEIMQKDITLEEYLGAVEVGPATVELGSSELFTQEELLAAVVRIKCEFAAWGGCRLDALRYAGDESAGEEALERLNADLEGEGFTRCADFLMDYRGDSGQEYRDFPWHMGYTSDGGWEIVGWGE